MIDLSDGLATDLAHVCEESGVGATLDASRIPIAPAARRLGGDPLLHALSDGEDYELLFTVPAREAGRLSHVIGRVDKAGGLRLRRPDGRQEPIAVRGWEHRWS